MLQLILYLVGQVFFNFTTDNGTFSEQFWIGIAINFLKKKKRRNLVLWIDNVEKWEYIDRYMFWGY